MLHLQVCSVRSCTQISAVALLRAWRVTNIVLWWAVGRLIELGCQAVTGPPLQGQRWVGRAALQQKLGMQLSQNYQGGCMRPSAHSLGVRQRVLGVVAVHCGGQDVSGAGLGR